MITPKLEIFEYNSKNNIAVTVKIDYNRGKISLVEQDGEEYKPKKYVFAERRFEFMGSWMLILQAMTDAVDIATKKLEQYQLEKEDEVVELVGKIIKQEEEL